MILTPPREKKLLRRFAQGKTDRQIAREIGGTDSRSVYNAEGSVTSQVQSLPYYIDLLHNGCSGDGTDLQGPRHGLPRNGRASGGRLKDDVVVLIVVVDDNPRTRGTGDKTRLDDKSCNEPELRPWNRYWWLRSAPIDHDTALA